MEIEHRFTQIFQPLERQGRDGVALLAIKGTATAFKLTEQLVDSFLLAPLLAALLEAQLAAFGEATFANDALVNAGVFENAHGEKTLDHVLRKG